MFVPSTKRFSETADDYVKRMKELIGKGMEVTACEACAEARGYHKEDTPEGVKRASMDWYLAKTVKTDKLLHIGGE